MKCLFWGLVAVMLLPVLHYGRRAFVADRFIVKGSSMEPSYHSGEKVYVCKPVIGARIYKSFEFGEDDPLECFRMPGLRKLRVGDAAIINAPYGRGWGKIAFRINFVYLKRCVGCPGDTLSIVDCHYVNSRVGDVGVPLSAESRLRSVPDSMLLRAKAFRAGQFAGRDDWTVKDFGPLPIPGKGTGIVLDEEAVAMYSKILEYELGAPAEPDGSLHVFAHDYYFFAGDNVVDSRDSRYFGLVPDDFVVGVVN